MAQTLNGTGTRYLGIGRPDADGWRTTTLWIVFFGMPLLPLKREILRPVGENLEFTGVTLRFEILSSGWINPVEVLLTYVTYWALILPLALGPSVVLLNLVSFHREIFQGWPDWIAPTLGLGSVVWIAVVVLFVGIKRQNKLLARPWSNPNDSPGGTTIRS